MSCTSCCVASAEPVDLQPGYSSSVNTATPLLSSACGSVASQVDGGGDEEGAGTVA